ncbi:MAG: hypothetical protein OXC28_15645 [Defluviicoccus sp.]|nr:hypothetical protein [Defluviicoccus sp.]
MAVRSHRFKAIPALALVALALAGPAGCGGGGGSPATGSGSSATGSGGGNTLTILPLPASRTAPDLAVGSPAVSDNGPAAGAGFTLSATVDNAGDGAAPATTLRWFRSTDAAITTGDASEGTDALAALAASAGRGVSTSLTAPITAGTYYYGACVDAVTGESDTTDNCSASVRVDVVESATRQLVSGRPNLELGSPRVDDNGPDTGASFTLRVSVNNAGDGAAPATTLRWYRSTDATITTGDASEGTDALAALPARVSLAVSVSLTAPAAAGVYYYGACVDAVADESDTTDNCSASVRVDVEEPQSGGTPLASTPTGRVVVLPDSLLFDALGQSKSASVQVLDENDDPVASPDLTVFGLFSPCCHPFLANPPKSIDIAKTATGVTITARGPGRGSVTLGAAGAASATLTVRVRQTPSTLAISPGSANLSVGGTTVLGATIEDANGNAIRVSGADGQGGHVVYWSSDAEGVATVEGGSATLTRNTGRSATVTATGAGSATITARWGGILRTTATVTVTHGN